LLHIAIVNISSGGFVFLKEGAVAFPVDIRIYGPTIEVVRIWDREGKTKLTSYYFPLLFFSVVLNIVEEELFEILPGVRTIWNVVSLSPDLFSLPKGSLHSLLEGDVLSFWIAPQALPKAK